MRFGLSFIFGAVVTIAVGTLLNWNAAALAGWDTFVICLIGMIWHDFTGRSPSETATIARQDSMNHSILDTLVLLASVMSIGAVFALMTSRGDSVPYIIFGLVSIVLSWAAVHTIYTLRYAMMYYRDTEGGIDFGVDKPRFSDFAYLAFTIGMTYQVSDTAVSDYKIRRLVMGQAFVSFIFGVVIIATTINFLAGLAK